jgi:hypothetical protein
MLSPALLLFALAAPAAPVVPSAHSPEVTTRLGYLVGDWAIQGVPVKSFRQKCSWYSGASFVLCTFQDQRDGTVGQTIFGYSEIQRRFTYYRLDSRGRSVHQLGYPTGTYGIVFTDERLEPEGQARVQTTLNLVDEGLHYTQYKSVEGREWQRTGDFLYVPAAQAKSRKKKVRRR